MAACKSELRHQSLGVKPSVLVGEGYMSTSTLVILCDVHTYRVRANPLVDLWTITLYV